MLKLIALGEIRRAFILCITCTDPRIGKDEHGCYRGLVVVNIECRHADNTTVTGSRKPRKLRRSWPVV